MRKWTVMVVVVFGMVVAMAAQAAAEYRSTTGFMKTAGKIYKMWFELKDEQGLRLPRIGLQPRVTGPSTTAWTRSSFPKASPRISSHRGLTTGLAAAGLRWRALPLNRICLPDQQKHLEKQAPTRSK